MKRVDGWSRVVDLADVPVLMRAAGERRSRALETQIAGAATHPGRPVAVIAYGLQAPARPNRPPDQTIEDIRIWRGIEETVVMDDARTGVLLTARAAEIGGDGDLLELRYRRFFHLAAAHLLAAHGRFLLHAAGLVHRGRVQLAFGDTGAGKSTLALAALENGEGILGDDMTALRLGAHGPAACGIGLPAAVPGDLGGVIAGGAQPMGDPRRRRSLPGRHLKRGWFPVAGSLLVEHGVTPAGEIRCATETATLHAAMRSFSGLQHPPFLRAFFPCAGAISRLPSCHLAHGCDPSSRLSAARILLDHCRMPGAETER